MSPRSVLVLTLALAGALPIAAAPASAAPLQGAVAIDAFAGATSIGDVNGDGYDDLGSADGTVVWGDPNLAPLSAAGDLGTRGTKFPLTGASGAPVAALGDVDHDGYDDFALGGGLTAKGGYVVYGGPGRTGLPVTPGPRVGFVKTGYSDANLRGIGDFNGDGYDDILANRTSSTLTDPNVRGGATIILGGPRIGTIDANAAGSRTLVINGSTSCKLIWIVFVPIGYQCTVAYGGASPVGDIDGDGMADVSIDNGRDDGRSILLGRSAATGSMTISAPTAPSVKVKPFPGSNSAGFPWHLEAIGDVNGDGKDDLVVPRYGGGLNDHAVLLGRSGLAGGTLDVGAPSYTVKVDTLSLVTGIGDTDGDGADDLAVANRMPSPAPHLDTYDLGILSGLRTQAAGSVIAPSAAVPVPGVPLSRWNDYSRLTIPRAAGDLDGDHQADLLVPDGDGRAIIALRAADRVAPELAVDRTGGTVVGPIATVEPEPLQPGPGSASITVTLQEAATVTVTVKSPSGATLGSFARTLPKWQSQIAWDGAVAGQPLAAGDYTLALTPRDSAGNVGATRTVAFSVTSGAGAPKPATLAVKALLQMPDGTPLSGNVDISVRCPDALVTTSALASGTTADVAGEARYAGDACTLVGAPTPTGVTAAANCFWQGAGVLNGAPLEATTGTLSAGANLLTVTYTCTGGVLVSVLPPERLGSGKWLSYGSASLLPGSESLTLTTKPNESGAVVWPVPIDPNGWEFTMYYLGTGGTGQAEGAAMSFIPATAALPPAGLAPLGGSGGGLGIGGVPATTIALDANRNPGDPAAAFVGIAESSTATGLNYVAWADPGVRLRGTNIALKVVYKGGVLSVYVNYKLRLQRTMALPSRAYLAISGSTGAIYQRQAIGGFSVIPAA